MNHEKIRYYTSLVMSKMPACYVEIIKSHSRFTIIETNQKDQISYELIGPKTVEYDKKAIKCDLIERSIDIGIYHRDIVNKVSDDIYKAQTAEKIVNNGIMRIKFETSKGILIEIDVPKQIPPDSEALIDYYAFIRINLLIEEMDIGQQYQIEKCIITDAQNN